MEDVEHSPFVGREYRPGGIAIAGHSHYLDPPEQDRSELTIEVLERITSGREDYFFFRAIMRAFDSSDPKLFWADKVFFNILPSSIGTSAQMSGHGTPAQWDRLGPRMFEILDRHQPSRLFVFSVKAWRAMPNGAQFEASPTPERTWYAQKGGETLAIGIRHPRGARTEHLRDNVKVALNYSVAR
ncbi:hypothetical protein B5C34_12860 [Pacificimonas flava]|uniref:Uracil-DNA glycosylase-like domain-containing protein n=2 Tax=Pacificimonas TaxID=1960290 RepID=A0A219B7A3_9SPHN|nr:MULTISPECIES: hypothetical protein [Pacificimonas]MBZ6378441.1 hypothetical protein [Pacificimonas aurantium]OWV34260.1 hypothetical protein B5C34_12860 [Pacificimonas flava]